MMFNKSEKGRIVKAVETMLAYQDNSNLEADVILLKKVRSIETIEDMIEKLNNTEVKLSEE